MRRPSTREYRADGGRVGSVQRYGAPGHDELTGVRGITADDQLGRTVERAGHATDDRLRAGVVLHLAPHRPVPRAVSRGGGLDHDPLDSDRGEVVVPRPRGGEVVGLQPERKRGCPGYVGKEVLQHLPPPHERLPHHVAAGDAEDVEADQMTRLLRGQLRDRRPGRGVAVLQRPEIEPPLRRPAHDLPVDDGVGRQRRVHRRHDLGKSSFQRLPTPRYEIDATVPVDDCEGAESVPLRFEQHPRGPAPRREPVDLPRQHRLHHTADPRARGAQVPNT